MIVFIALETLVKSNGEKTEVPVIVKCETKKLLGPILIMSLVNLGCVRTTNVCGVVLWWYYSQEGSSKTKRNISKSNKSELWNRLSYRDLPYFFEGLGNETVITIYS